MKRMALGKFNFRLCFFILLCCSLLLNITFLITLPMFTYNFTSQRFSNVVYAWQYGGGKNEAIVSLCKRNQNNIVNNIDNEHVDHRNNHQYKNKLSKEENAPINENPTATKTAEITFKSTVQKRKVYKTNSNCLPGLVTDWYKDVHVHPTLYNLKWHPLFPHMPFKTTVMTSLTETSYVQGAYARRIFGFLIPDESSVFEFELGSRDGMEFLLVDTNTNIENAKNVENLRAMKVILNFTFSVEEMEKQDKVRSAHDIFKKNMKVHLIKERMYFIDILQGGWNYGRIDIKWRNKDSTFKEIKSPQICYHKDMRTQLHKVTLHEKIIPKKKINENEHLRMRYHEIPNIDLKLHLSNSSCEKFVRKTKEVNGFNGVYVTEQWSTYPEDGFGHYPPYTKNQLYMDEKDAMNIINRAATIVQENIWRKLYVRNIVQVQKNFDHSFKMLPRDQQFYFLEYDVSLDEKSKKHYRVTNYAHVTQNNTICFRTDFRWNATSKIHLLTPFRNQGYWIHHLLHSLEKIMDATHEVNIELILVDYNSTDINITKLLRNHRVPYKYVFKNATLFNKVEGLNLALSYVNDDAIAFVLDLHLELPDNLFDKIRKHTIRNISAYSPSLLKFGKGAHEQYYDKSVNSKQWEWIDYGYGMISLYKSDWRILGGMNEKEFGTKWGGEDWELIDRLLAHGYYLFHSRLPRFYHIYHSNKDIWDGKKGT